MIEVHWATDRRPATDEAVQRAAAAAALHGGRAGLALSVVFVPEEELTALHAEHLGDPTPTDVITFDLGDGGGPQGELYVSVDRALAEASQRGVPAERELLLYVVHGVLHLCGHDDHEPHDRARMRAAERAVLEQLGYPPDETPREGLGPAWT